MALKIEFDEAPFIRSHMTTPRGRGSYAFSIEGQAPIFSPSGTYAEAKKWAKAQVLAIAPADAISATVEVLP